MTKKFTTTVMWKKLDDGRYFMCCPYLVGISVYADSYNEAKRLIKEKAQHFFQYECDEQEREYLLAPVERGIVYIPLSEIMENGRNGLFDKLSQAGEVSEAEGL
ncbi:MAG: hypothetical protein LBM98_00850 [Oscillospiraceae bacterium]|jgi:predicted RNase H-like HicB family nuclease|nr:hypothetical protein [Oscillospiraceae bacterium]